MLSLAACCGLGVGSSAGSDGRGGSPDTEPVLRVDSSLVLVPVLVTDTVGRTVNGLGRDSFSIAEDRVEQTIATFGSEDTPVSVGLLFDASGSMRAKLGKSTEAAAAFFRTANPEDEFFLVEFGERARLLSPFTRDTGKLYQEIAHTRADGRTTLIDAIHLALAQMRNARNARKALVILSDGGDNWSRHSVRELRLELLETVVQVYAMGIFEPEMPTREEKNGPQLLQELTSETGGRLYPVDDVEDLPEISSRIGHELRSQYLLGYYSTNLTRDGKYRRVTVKLRAPHSREFHIDYRRGYYGPSN